MHDTDASVPAMTTVRDEALHARARLRCGHAVKIATIAGLVLAALQLPELAAVDSGRNEILVGAFVGR